MMKIFDKIRRTRTSGTSTERKLMAAHLAINKMLSQLALYLQHRTATLTVRRFRLILVLFCCIWCSLSLCILLNAFTSGNETFITTQPIQVPKYYHRTGEEGLKTRSSGSENEPALRQFIDSMNKLHGSAAGRRVYDSLLSARPHLIDSIHRLNQLQATQK